MLVRDILSAKGSSVVTVDPTRPIQAAVHVLVEHNIGAVVVTEGADVVGILSERDVLRLLARGTPPLEACTVADIMSTDLVVGVPDDAVDYAMAVMTNNRVRHLPVLEDGRLAGIVSIGDLVNATLSDLQAENRWLRDYVQGAG